MGHCNAEPIGKAQRNISSTDTAEPSAKPRRPRRMAREADAGTSPVKAEPQRVPSKIDQVLALLRREEGATLAELIAATGWLPHSTRAALTGLRKKGHVLSKSQRADVTCYRIALEV